MKQFSREHEVEITDHISFVNAQKIVESSIYVLESRLLGEISTASEMQMTPALWQKQRRTKEPLDESERQE